MSVIEEALDANEGTTAFRLEAPLGELVIARGFATEEQIRECLDAQADMARKGQDKRLGDLLVERGYLLAHQLEAVLKEQKEAPKRRQIKDFELLAKLGEGGMGAVFKARRPRDGALVAMKVLFKRLAADEQYIARFHREAAIGLTLDHPNVIKCLEVGEDNGLHYMALEYISGNDLGAALTQRDNFAEAQALAIVLAAAKGIEYAHKKGLIHRDIKPANIMLTAEGTVKVMDFGLARQRFDADHSLTLTGVVMGTPHYMSPEQVDGSVDLDGRSDIYSLGVTLFHMLTGRPPFIGGNLYGVLTAHLTSHVPDPRQYNKGVSPETADLVLRMCARDREERVQSLEHVVLEISRLLGLPSAEQLAQLVASRADEEWDPAKMPSTRVAYNSILDELRCPRCTCTFMGDPGLVSKDQRLRCHNCGLVFTCPVSPPNPPAILPRVIQIEKVPEEAARTESKSVDTADMLRLSLEANKSLELKPPPAHRPSYPRVMKQAMWWALAIVVVAFAGWVVSAILGGTFDRFFTK
ncbi:MAG: protein kinase [Planctomycetes bacterium]|nr:protein kinase [Planctomycetota bacterium]